MHIRKTRIASRTASVGTVLAVAAAIVLCTATASYAANVISQTKGPTAGTNTITITGTGFASGAAVQFETATCAATFTSPATGFVNATTTTFTSTTVLTVVVPALAAATYNVCPYVGNSNGSSALVGAGMSYTTVAAGTATVTPVMAAVGGSVTVADSTTAFGAGTAVEFNAASACPTTYTATSTTVLAGTVATFTPGVSTVSVTVPGLTKSTAYSVCAYTGNTATTSALITGANAGFALTGLVLNPPKGPVGTAATVVGTDTSATFNASTAVEIGTTGCAATYAAPSATVLTASVTSFTTTTLTMAFPPLSAGTYSACAYAGTTVGTSALLSGMFFPTYAATGALTLSSNNGPDAGGNSITATSSANQFFTGTAVLFVSQATATPCPMIYNATGAIPTTAAPRVLAQNRLAITVPAGVTALAGPTFHICAYSGTTSGPGGSPLLAATTVVYTVAAPATILTVSPSAGAAQGGTLITVSGTNLSGITSATVGGVPLTNIISLGATAFTAVTPAHAAGGPFTIAVVTPGGTATKVGAFVYSNGIVVAPTKASNNGPVDIDVTGVGFGGITFTAVDTDGAHATAATGHVLLVNGTYDPTSTTNTSFKTNDALLECLNVLVISDLELVCTMSLAGDGTRVAFRSAGTAADGAVVKGSNLLTSAANATFTSTDVGLTVTGTGLPAGTTIVSIISATQALLSAPATGTVSGVALWPPRGSLTTATTVGSTTVTSSTLFLATDVGRTISGTGIQPGTTITAVTDTSTITISKPAIATATPSLTIGNPAVPPGAYTITVVSSGAADADISPTYVQSVISSGSTFTVSDY